MLGYANTLGMLNNNESIANAENSSYILVFFKKKVESLRQKYFRGVG